MNACKKYPGLSEDEVSSRVEQGLVNKSKLTVGKSYARIIFDNVFNFFNIILFIIAGLMIYGGYYTGLFFLCVLLPNIGIGLYEDIKARRLMGKLHLMNAPRSSVIRNGEVKDIISTELVQDDILVLKADSQVTADYVLLEGSVAVNEAQLTGESNNVYKKVGDPIYSGSFIVSGEGVAKVDKVGKDCYIQKLQSVAQKFKRSKSEILSSLKHMFRVIDITVIVMAAAMFTVYGLQNKLSTEEGFKQMIAPISGSLVAMIPSGLYLLTSLALAVAVIALARKNAQVQDFYSVEMLARTDVICVDKTGTITDGSMCVKEIVAISQEKEGNIKAILGDLLKATGDNNATAEAIKKACTSLVDKKVVTALPFNSENKYSAVTFVDKTYILGAPEFIDLDNKITVIRKTETYTKEGYRVLVLASSNEKINKNKFVGKAEAIALIVLEDHIKEDAKETFAWFQENGVAIRVISGDNANTVSEIAKRVGIIHADQCISLEGLTEEEVRKAANEYVVFGRVSPEQKAILVEEIQKEGHKVAMTGDGVNDILALKKADCSIAMASGSEASRNVSHIVLLNSNFSSLPDVVAEGRRVVNNLQRTSSLFLVKTFFAVVATFVFLIITASTQGKHHYPFVTNNFYIWEFAGIGLPSFFIALEPNKEQLNGKFLKNVTSKVIPAGITMVLGIFIFYIMFVMYQYGHIYTPITTFETASALSTIFMSLFCLVVLFKICVPFDKYRVIVFAVFGMLGLLALVVGGLLSYNGSFELFKIPFAKLDGAHYFVVAIVFVVITALYIFVTYLIDIIKEHKKEIKGYENGI